MGTEAVDVAPRGGTLVLFDSVTSPHEVTAVGDGEARVAMAGWFHESQQEFPQWVQA
jgi:Rps23 Pro-64 3,4-dihydroxylase Tpa1-like proline 4-hydroxylase